MAKLNTLRDIRKHVRVLMKLAGDRGSIRADLLDEFNDKVQELCEENGVLFEASCYPCTISKHPPLCIRYALLCVHIDVLCKSAGRELHDGRALA